MNIKITTFNNPFKFFCLIEGEGKDDMTSQDYPAETFSLHNPKLSDLNHGQYIAVMWKNKWVRGIVHMETQFLVWLIDYGIHLRVDDKTVYMNLSPEYKKLPSKLFEASIHGVVPIDKQLNDMCAITDIVAKTWTKGAVTRAQEVISEAARTYFVPVAILNTKYNDIIIGDLYLDIPNKGIVNIIDELEIWPVCLKRDKESYIQSLSLHYTSHRLHHACHLQPVIPEFKPSVISVNTTLKSYSAICDSTPIFNIKPISEDGSTLLACPAKTKDKFKLTADEIERYSSMYIELYGREYNVLHVLINKIRDLKMCDKYKNCDLKSIGCANRRVRSCLYN